MFGLNFFLRLLNSQDSNSSARFINLTGAMVASFLIILDTFWNNALRPEALVPYLSYCSINYGLNKYIEHKQKENNSLGFSSEESEIQEMEKKDESNIKLL